MRTCGTWADPPARETAPGQPGDEAVPGRGLAGDHPVGLALVLGDAAQHQLALGREDDHRLAGAVAVQVGAPTVGRPQPVVRLVPVAQGAFKIGLLRGKLGTGPDFFEPMEESVLGLWKGER